MLWRVIEAEVVPASEELGVQVNPRFGVWDPIQLAVVDADQTAGTIVRAPAAP